MDDIDVAAKDRARRSRASGRHGAEHASKLDERIAAKSGRSSAKDSRAHRTAEVDNETAARARAVARAAHLDQMQLNVPFETRASAGRTPAASTSQYDEDVAMKNACRPGRNASRDVDDLDGLRSSQTPIDVSFGSRKSTRSISETNEEDGLWKSQGDAKDGDVVMHRQRSSRSHNLSFRSRGRNEFGEDGDGLLKSPGKGSQGHEDNRVPETTVAHGISNDPGFEYGTYTNDGHGFGDSLAVAVAVAEDEDDALIPAAIEFDPDSKPPIYKNRRFRFYFIAAAILLAAVGVGAALTVASAAENDGEPTAAPTTEREGTDINEQILSFVGETNMNDPKSPQVRAAQWIMNDDPMQLPPDADNLMQRYLLALFYLSTSEKKPWLACNPPMEGEDASCVFPRLTQIFPETVYENITWGKWLSRDHECAWAGILCDEFNQTRAIELPGLEIFSTFPSEIALMPYLQSVTLNWNEFYGTLPSELASMKHLLNIEVHYNFFTGQVPPEWYSARTLQRINIAGNWLSGTIPSEIGQLSTMKGFFSFENSIGGTLPTEIGNMKFLAFSRMGRNFMNGTLPTEVGNLEKLQEFWIHRNQFSGPMPSEMGNMKDIGDLRLHYNLFTGMVPEEHYSMPQLRRWDLYDMNLTSTISTTIGLMSNLQTYRIRANNFYGEIPTEMGLVKGLSELWLHYNDLEGSMPNEVCALRGTLGLVILDADCGPTNSIGDPMIDCMSECCTGCCDSVSGYCMRDVFVESEFAEGGGNRYL